jgi:hypothetical protein
MYICWPFFLQQGMCTYVGHSFFNKVCVHTLAILSSTRYMYIRWPFFLQQGICTYLAIISSTRYMYIRWPFFLQQGMCKYVVHSFFKCWRKNGQHMYIYLVEERMAKYVLCSLFYLIFDGIHTNCEVKFTHCFCWVPRLLVLLVFCVVLLILSIFVLCLWSNVACVPWLTLRFL